MAVFLVYQPAWRGGFLWDDDDHVTRRQLQSWQGLGRIWTEVGATLQYYPLLHSFFWLEHRLWGDAVLGYHLTNIALHALAAILAWRVLRALNVPGAWLAVSIFALHPVHVESVAWITEQKNTLSAVFYLAAALVYLRFDRTRKLAGYLAAAALFVLALLTKTITGTLPGALLVVFWWQRGRLAWKRDVLPLVPFFVLGAGGGMITAWWELELNKCVGPEFEFTGLQRLLIAGRAVWFHAGKLFWPTRLTFIYPRWQVDVGAWWQWLFPLGAAALLAVLWAVRRRSRAPLAAALYFGGTLFPMLGFFNLYTFRYSLVANHYQYLASLGIIALASAGVALVLDGWRVWGRPAGYAICLSLLAILGGLTWRQSRIYADVQTLYEATIAENPECWMAYGNLGLALAGRGEHDAAMDCYRKALEIKPDYVQAHTNLGVELGARGQADAAVAHYRRALEIDPAFADAHFNLGAILAARKEFGEALQEFQKALESKPDHWAAHYMLARMLAGRGQLDAAIEHYREAVEGNPNYAEGHNDLAAALFRKGRVVESVAGFRKALALKPDYALARHNFGLALAELGRLDEAIEQFQEAVRIKPAFVEAHTDLGSALAHRGRLDEAIAHYRRALAANPGDAEARRRLDAAEAARRRP